MAENTAAMATKKFGHSVKDFKNTRQNYNFTTGSDNKHKLVASSLQ